MCKNCPKRKEYCGGLRFEGADYHNCPSFDKMGITDKELWSELRVAKGCLSWKIKEIEMTKEEKLDYINKRCETKEICFGCPIWEYMKKEGDLLICTDVDIDTAYELLVNDGTC